MKINFSNKFAYTIIVLVILILIAFGINAYGGNNPSVMGHSVNELAPPASCAVGQFLQFNTASPNAWVCAYSLANASNACAGANLSIKTINPATGAVTCEVDDVGSGSGGVSGSGSINTIPKFTGASSLGSSIITQQDIATLLFSFYNVGSGQLTGTTVFADNEIYRLSNSGSPTTLFLQWRQASAATTDIGRGALIVQGNNGNTGVGISPTTSKLTVAGDIALTGVIKNSSAGDVIIQLG